jgi:hypothetical protein
MSPRANGPHFVDRAVEAGVTAFSFNVELYSEAAARRHMPLKYTGSRPYIGPTISRAVELLGRESGSVRSLIIPGLEPIEETLAGVDWLASLGCWPVLSPFRPARDTALENEPPAAAGELQTLLAQSRTIVRTHGVRLGPPCIPCQHNTLTFPWDVGEFAAG